VPRGVRVGCTIVRASGGVLLLCGGHDDKMHTQFGDACNGFFGLSEVRTLRLATKAVADAPTEPVVRFGRCTAGLPGPLHQERNADSLNGRALRGQLSRSDSGKIVMLHGLAGRTDLNGTHGRVLRDAAHMRSFDTIERLPVEIDGAGNGSDTVARRVQVRPRNLYPATRLTSPSFVWCASAQRLVALHADEDFVLAGDNTALLVSTVAAF